MIGKCLHVPSREVVLIEDGKHDMAREPQLCGYAALEDIPCPPGTPPHLRGASTSPLIAPTMLATSLLPSHAPDFYSALTGRFVRPPPATIVGTVGASPLTLVPCVSGTRRNALCRVLY